MVFFQAVFQPNFQFNKIFSFFNTIILNWGQDKSVYFCDLSIAVFVIIFICYMIEFTYSSGILFSPVQVGGTIVKFCEWQWTAINDSYKLWGPPGLIEIIEQRKGREKYLHLSHNFSLKQLHFRLYACNLYLYTFLAGSVIFFIVVIFFVQHFLTFRYTQ